METNRDKDDRRRPLLSPWLQRTIVVLLVGLGLLGTFAAFVNWYLNKLAAVGKVPV